MLKIGDKVKIKDISGEWNWLQKYGVETGKEYEITDYLNDSDFCIRTKTFSRVYITTSVIDIDYKFYQYIKIINDEIERCKIESN